MTSSFELKSQFKVDFFLFEHDAPVGMPDDVKVRFYDVIVSFDFYELNVILVCSLYFSVTWQWHEHTNMTSQYLTGSIVREAWRTVDDCGEPGLHCEGDERRFEPGLVQTRPASHGGKSTVSYELLEPSLICSILINIFFLV